MQRTIFTTPVVNSVLRVTSVGLLRLAGWRVEGSLPPAASKCVMIAAPHSTNWDLPFALMASFALRLNVVWMGKAGIFNAPFGALMRWLGGIPVQREQANNLVASSAAALRAAQGPLQMVVPPEGTRSRVRRWKTGFYYIALAAELPIQLAYIDYTDKCVGLGPLFQPTGDIDADLAVIKAFYAPFRGKGGQRVDAAS